MVDEINEYLEHLSSLGNPIYFSLLFTLIILFLLIFFFKYVVAPLRKKHLLEKKELELKNLKLMALFAELDPNPLIRIDSDGKIIHINEAAQKLSPEISLEGKNINELISSINFSIKEFIEKDKHIIISESINNKFFSIHIKGISYLNIAQLYFDDLTERKIFEEELQQSRKKLSELSEHLRDTLEDERQRIARELHDSIGQNLHLIRMKIQNSGDGNRLSEKDYQTLLKSVEVSINELKEIIFDLKPKILEEMGLGFSIKLLVEKIAVETGMKGTADIHGEVRYDKKMELSVYRIVQEALSNIVKHSKAKEFNIQLMNKNKSVKLLISDDGEGFDFNNLKNNHRNSGFGLLNMQERINSYNGKLKIDSSPENGTIIIIDLPQN